MTKRSKGFVPNGNESPVPPALSRLDADPADQGFPQQLPPGQIGEDADWQAPDFGQSSKSQSTK